MIKETLTDIKAFIAEHRGVIYFVVIAWLVDHYMLKDAFRARIQKLFDGLLAGVEKTVNKE